MIRVQDAPFSAGDELTAFSKPRALERNKTTNEVGGTVSFVGTVRDVSAGLEAMVIEHYPDMTEQALEQIARQARNRWDILDVLIIHRYGRLTVGEQIMMVAVCAPSRSDAFAAADFIMDYLKSRAPFWKKEITKSGEAWVEAKTSDELAIKRWV